MDDRIERYMNGLMPEEELNLFLEEINKNEELKSTIDVYREMNAIYNDDDWEIMPKDKKNPTIEKHVEFLRSEKGNHIKNVILEEQENYFNQQPKRNFKKIISLTASIAAILTIGFFLLNSPNDSLYDDYKNNWQELPSLTLRGKNTDATKIETLFANKKYKEALTALNIFAKETNIKDSQILIYKGILHLELNEHDKAITVFKELQDSNSSFYNTQKM